MKELRNITFDATKLDEYQRGVISGIMYMATGKPEETFAWGRSNDKTRWYKTLECTLAEFDEVVSEIYRLFPAGVILETN